MRRSRKVLLFGCLGLLVVAGGVLAVVVSRLADIRPASLIRDGVTPAATALGHQQLARMELAHGGYDAWKRFGTATLELRDLWSSDIARRIFSPWPANAVPLRFTEIPGQDTSCLEFLDGPERGQVWGIQNWATYRAAAGGKPQFKQENALRFWLPTMQYFFDAPFRLREADVVAALDPAPVKGVPYERVFLSWGKAEPQADVDQYIAWIDPSTGRLGFLEYTVRDILPMAKGCMAYRDYQQVQGLWVPMTMAVCEAPGGADTMHRIEVSDVRFDEEQAASLIPRPDVRSTKHD